MLYNQSPPVKAPYIYTGINTRHTALLFLFLLLLHIAVMGFMHDFAGILLIICTGAAAVCASLLIDYRQGKATFDIHTLLTGLLIGFFLPIESGFIFSFFVAFMSYFLSWGVFGGKGTSWINPVMLAACIAAVGKPDCFVQPVNFDQIVSGGNVFAALETASNTIKTFEDQHLTSILNSTLLHSVGVTLPEGYIGLFFLYPSSIPAFRYNILTLLCSVILLSSKAIHKTVPFTFLAVYGMLVYFFPPAMQQHTYGRGDILSAILTSGALFSAFFVMNDGGSLPRSWGGRLICGSLTGIFAFCIIGPGAYPAGIPFAVILVNCITPLIEQLETYVYKKKREAL